MEQLKVFQSSSGYFRLFFPEYETPVFGQKVCELRSASIHPNEVQECEHLSDLYEYLSANKYLFCTYRGVEDIHIVRILNSLGFEFVSTYKNVQCNAHDFREIPLNSDLDISVGDHYDHDKALMLEKGVMDYSTFQIDPLVDANLSSNRNVVRVKSYFSHPQHKMYVLRKGTELIGFLQFLVDGEARVADCVNGAIAREYQRLFIGPRLYSEAFKSLFKMGIKTIRGGFSSQNKPVVKLFAACNFRVVSEEIHLRLSVRS
jgi:ribosomal protein S18 acetylase RimI-like enzyme